MISPRSYVGPDYTDGLLLQSIRTRLAGGSVAGDVTIVSHGEAPSQYAVEAVVQNANLAEVVGPAVKTPMQGTLSASFDVEGIFGDTNNRRGRGRMQVHGHNMYEAPIILGFFRLVNFALPVRDGVNDVDVSYTLMRDRATFDSIELTAPGLRIYGDGVLDFAKHQINMTLNTENPDAWTLPFVNQLVRRAREELLQIKIKGSLEEPKVQALTFPTFQATLDQVVQEVKEGRRSRTDLLVLREAVVARLSHIPVLVVVFVDGPRPIVRVRRENVLQSVLGVDRLLQNSRVPIGKRHRPAQASQFPVPRG